MKKILLILLFIPVFLPAQSIHISTLSDTTCSGTFVHFNATDTGISSPHFHWRINSTNAGSDSSGFTTHTLSNNDTVSCLLTNLVGDTIFAVSNNLVITVQHMPVVSPIIGFNTYVCAGSTISFSDSTIGGVWNTQYGFATVSGGIVKGIISAPGNPPGIDYVVYTVTNSCGSNMAWKEIEIDQQPVAEGLGDGRFILCVGSSIIIDGGDYEGGMIYSTTGNAYFDGIYLHATHEGTDFLFAEVTNACGDSISGDSVYVIGNPVAPKRIMLALTDVCVGDTTIAADSSTLDPNPSFAWAVSNGNAKINKSGVITGVSPGIATVIFSIANGCGSTNTDTTINVLPPGHIIAFDSFCVGKTKALTDTTLGGIWSSLNPGMATIDQSGVINSLAAGSVLIDYSFGSCTVSKLVTINPILPVIGNDNLCIGSKVNFYGDTTKGHWSTHDSSIAIIDTAGLIRAISAGNAIMTYTSKPGCISTKQITVNPLPQINGNPHIFYGATTDLSGTINGGAWSTNDSSIAAIMNNSGIVYGNNNGTTIVTYTLPTGCFDTMTVTVSFTKNEMLVYPNPSKGEIIIYAYTDLYQSFAIYSYDGRELLKQPLDGPLTKVNIQSLPAGVYMLTLYGEGNRTFVRKIWKE